MMNGEYFLFNMKSKIADASVGSMTTERYGGVVLAAAYLANPDQPIPAQKFLDAACTCAGVPISQHRRGEMSIQDYVENKDAEEKSAQA